MDKDKQSYGSAYLYAEDLLSDGKFKSVEVEISELHEPHTLQRADGKFIDKPARSRSRTKSKRKRKSG